jgi:hypothetical protein
MNHIKFLTRFLIVIVWLILGGILYSLFNVGYNMEALGWPTYLIWGTLIVFLFYGAITFTLNFWNQK